MDFYNRLKSFLGFPNGESYGGLNSNRSPPETNRENFTRDIPREQHPSEYDRFGFNIFSSPLEMHRYFEHQMNEIMKNFGMFGSGGSFFDNGDSFFGSNGDPFFGDNPFSYDSSQFPAIEDYHSKEHPGNLRDHYLKPGYEGAVLHEQNKSDKDVDGKCDMGDLDSVLRGRPAQVQPRIFSFGQSITSQTIRNSDGTTETHRTVRDQYGNEETTITRRQGDKEYSVTTRTNRDGQQEVTENLINIDEKDKDAFLGNDNRPRYQLTDSNEKLPPNWFPFNKFFK